MRYSHINLNIILNITSEYYLPDITVNYNNYYITKSCLPNYVYIHLKLPVSII